MLLLGGRARPQLADINIMREHDHMIFPPMQGQYIGHFASNNGYNKIITESGLGCIDAGRKVHTFAE